MTVTLTLPPGTEIVLSERAARAGLTLEEFLQHLAIREVNENKPAVVISDDEFESMLDALSESNPEIPVLTGCLSRTELYEDHD